MPTLPTTFDEIRAVAAALPAADPQWDEPGLVAWLAYAQRRDTAEIVRPRLAVFAAAHGIATATVSGEPEGLSRAVAELVAETGPFHRLVADVDADLRLYELALDRLTADSREGQAMSEAEAAHAMAYGMMAVEPGPDLLVLSALGDGAAMAAAAIGMTLFGGLPEDWSPQHGQAISVAEARHRGENDPLKLLAALGGPDIAAMMGAIMAARLAGVPILLDGAPPLAAAALVRVLRGDAVGHCRPAAGDAKAGEGFVAALRMMPVVEEASNAPLTGAVAISAARHALEVVRS